MSDRYWIIFVCDEPDGEDCDSGTHPNMLTHRCQAIKNWRAWQAAAYTGEVRQRPPSGPKMRMVKVVPIEEVTP